MPALNRGQTTHAHYVWLNSVDGGRFKRCYLIITLRQVYNWWPVEKSFLYINIFRYVWNRHLAQYWSFVFIKTGTQPCVGRPKDLFFPWWISCKASLYHPLARIINWLQWNNEMTSLAPVAATTGAFWTLRPDHIGQPQVAMRRLVSTSSGWLCKTLTAAGQLSSFSTVKFWKTGQCQSDLRPTAPVPLKLNLYSTLINVSSAGDEIVVGEEAASIFRKYGSASVGDAAAKLKLYAEQDSVFSRELIKHVVASACFNDAELLRACTPPELTRWVPEQGLSTLGLAASSK